MKKKLAVLLLACSSCFAQQKATSTLTLVVTAPVTITTATLPACTAGSLCSFSITASGGTAPYTYSFSGVASGAAITAGGAFMWTPATAGTTSLSFTAKDSTGLTATKQFSLTVNAAIPPLSILPITLPSGVIGTAYSVALTAQGGVSPYSWALTAGTLPAGMTVSAAGVIGGTPTAATASTGTTFTITVTDSSGAAATHTASITWTSSVTPGATSINLLWANVSGGPYKQLNTTPITTQPFLHPNLPGGQTECYVATAISATGVQSGLSVESCKTTPIP